jgi:uncharacterized protein with HEPN domain
MLDRLGDKTRLIHIIEAIAYIEKYTETVNLSTFKTDTMLFDASVRQISIVGEASNHLSESIYETYPTIPWAQIISLRNLVMHEYFGIDKTLIWKIIREDLPIFKEQVIEILEAID